MTWLRSWFQRIGAGRLAYRWLYRPREQINLARAFGWWLVCRSVTGERAMRRAATRLSPFPANARPASAPLCFLTGPRFIHQTLFCAHSLACVTEDVPAYEFLSDGKLGDNEAAALKRAFPSAVVVRADELEARVAAALPPAKFPALHAVRRSFVLLRKLTDAMAGQEGFRLFLDSDMLFWSRPDELLARAAAADPLYMADIVDDGYPASRAEITQALGVPVAAGVNSGLVGLNASRIDWDLMERACVFLRSTPGNQRLIEQALWAVALGAQEARPLTATAYRVMVDPPHWRKTRAEHPTPVLMHYAWNARLPYLAGEWRRYLKTQPQNRPTLPHP